MHITFGTASHVSSHPSLFPQLRTGSFGAFLKHQTSEVSKKLLNKNEERNTMKNSTMRLPSYKVVNSLIVLLHRLHC
ncbi:hypothetical protein VIGAN_07051300, partial [Vigna angularis var. angularis]